MRRWPRKKHTVSNSNSLPTLVTYRSAEALRDSGIRFAYLRSGMLASCVIAVLLIGVALWLKVKSPETDTLIWLLVGLSVAAVAAMAGFGHAMEFPHSPRMTMEELETMRVEMGIPDHIYQQTNAAVLHGSMDEIRAGWKAEEVIQRIKKSLGHFE